MFAAAFMAMRLNCSMELKEDWLVSMWQGPKGKSETDSKVLYDIRELLREILRLMQSK
jgi:hypothetical protein